MLHLKIPFYEVGRIALIREEKNKYIVDRYNINGEIGKSLVINKKNKNLEELLDNYYCDLNGYLEFNRDKFEECKKNSFKNISYMKNFKNLKFVSFALSFLPLVGFLLDSGLLISIGVGLDFIFIPAFLVLESGSKQYAREEKKYNFAKTYINYVNDLKQNNKVKSKNINPTKYSTVELSKPPVDALVVNKIKEKKSS